MTLWDLYQKIPKRYILCLLAFLGIANASILRSNLSIAIVAMVKQPNDHNTSLVHTTGFDWSPKTQQIILSSFFYSFVLMQIPAGVLTTILGGKYLFGVGIGLCGLLTLFTSFCARIGPGALITLRVLEAIAAGFMMPALYSLLSKWATKDDKSKLATFTVSGYFGGIFVAMALGGLIAAYWTWEWIFYLSGASAIIWAILWFCFITESPSTHPTITPEELNYIQSNTDQTVIRNHSIPWRRILTSLPVWAIIIAHFGTNFVVYTMFTELPIFLTYVLGYRIDEAGGLASFPWLLYAIVLFGGGIVSDKLILHYPTIYVRKVMMTIAFTIVSLTLLVIVFLNVQQRISIVVSIMIVLSASALSTSSFIVNHLEIGGRYASLIMGLTNCASGIPGFIVPLLVAQFVPHTNSKEEWNFIFIFLISTSIATLLVFIFLASANVQPWVNDNSDEYQFVLDKTKASEENNIGDLTNRLRSELNSDDNKNVA